MIPPLDANFFVKNPELQLFLNELDIQNQREMLSTLKSKYIYSYCSGRDGGVELLTPFMICVMLNKTEHLHVVLESSTDYVDGSDDPYRALRFAIEQKSVVSLQYLLQIDKFRSKVSDRDNALCKRVIKDRAILFVLMSCASVFKCVSLIAQNKTFIDLYVCAVLRDIQQRKSNFEALQGTETLFDVFSVKEAEFLSAVSDYIPTSDNQNIRDGASTLLSLPSVQRIKMQNAHHRLYFLSAISNGENCGVDHISMSKFNSR